MNPLAVILGTSAYETSPDSVDSYCLTHSSRQKEELEAWGKAILEKLKRRGIYVNITRGDPAGRW